MSNYFRINSLSSLVLALFFSCNSPEKSDAISLNQDILNAMDTIVAKLEYKPLTTKQIIPAIHKLVHGKLKVNLPESFVTDSSNVENYIQELAITSTYAQWASSLNLTLIKDSSLFRASNMLDLLNDESSEKKFDDLKLDTVIFRTNEFFSRDSLTYLNAYFQALSWMENFSMTLNVSRNINNRIEYNSILRKQLLKGDELLAYLFDFQDYPPISEFSMQLISILEYKYGEIDVTRLIELITRMKSTVYYN